MAALSYRVRQAPHRSRLVEPAAFGRRARHRSRGTKDLCRSSSVRRPDLHPSGSGPGTRRTSVRTTTPSLRAACRLERPPWAPRILEVQIGSWRPWWRQFDKGVTSGNCVFARYVPRYRWFVEKETSMATSKKAGAKKKVSSKGGAGAKRKAAKRTLISPRGDKRYIRRDARGRIKESDDVSRSLSQDRRRKSKKKATRGQGDKGD